MDSGSSQPCIRSTRTEYASCPKDGLAEWIRVAHSILTMRGGTGLNLHPEP